MKSEHETKGLPVYHNYPSDTWQANMRLLADKMDEVINHLGLKKVPDMNLCEHMRREVKWDEDWWMLCGSPVYTSKWTRCPICGTPFNVLDRI